MASGDQSSVIRRSSRGRTGIDVKNKTDSGCFVDYDVDKQNNSEKSPPRSKTESIFKSKAASNVSFSEQTLIHTTKTFNCSQALNVNLSEQNSISSTSKIFSNGTLQNEVVHAGEMNHSDSSFNDEEAYDTSQSSRRDSSRDDKTSDDFYCLYYSDSPNGSLTRDKDKKDGSAFRFDDEDISVKAEELLQKVKSEAKRAQSKNDDTITVDQPNRKPPPVAPKPRKTSKTSDKSSKDPILDELEKLGASVGRDFRGVKENNPQLFSNAVKDLQVAKTAEECLDRFEEIQTALLENIPDTLERKKKTSNKEPRRKSLPDSVGKVRKLSDSSNNSSKETSSSKLQESKRSDAPKPTKKKFEAKTTFSRTERESLHLMKADSHHKRSHLNDNAKTTVPVRPDSYKTSKTEASKRLAERVEANKENSKKDKKASSPAKGAKISKKVELPSKPQRSGANASAKRKERLDLRSARRRMNGDLTSIPEDAVIGVRIDDLDDNSIPLAKGEDDLSSEEDDLDMFEEDEAEVNDECTNVELELPPPPTPAELSLLTPEENISTIAKTVETRESTSVTTSTNLFTGIRAASQEPERKERSLMNPSSQRCSNRSQIVSLSSDGWTSESTAGYSSANDADDEIERNQELETSEDFETYKDPEDIADMTFGTVIDGEEGDEYVFVQDTPYRVPRSDIGGDTRQRVQRKAVTSTFSEYPHTQNEELPLHDMNIEPHLAELENANQHAYNLEYYENDGEGMYYDNLTLDAPSEPSHHHVVQEAIAYDNVRADRYHDDAPRQQQQVQQTTRRKSNDESTPDPSGFMTVQDIKRLIFQGAKPSIPRSSSFCGAQSSLARLPKDQEFFQRQSWSGYNVRQQQHSVIDPLVKDFPQRKMPAEEPKRSPYVRTVVQPHQTLQHDFYSDSNISGVNNQRRRNVGRSQSFCGTSLQRRTNSLDNYQVGIVREVDDTERRTRSFHDAPAQWRSNSLDNQRNLREKADRERRSRSLCEIPEQRRTPSLDNHNYRAENGSNARPVRSQSFKGLPTQRRANSLDEYYSTERKASLEYQRNPPVMSHGRLFRSTSDSSSDYSHSDKEQYHQQFSRRSHNSKERRVPPTQQYMDAEELARLLSSQATREVVHQQSQNNNIQQRGINGRSAVPRKPSESLRVQAIRRASHLNSDSDSDSYVEHYQSPPPKPPPVKQNIVAAANPTQRKTLSERFSDIPQRVSFEELADQLNLPSSDDDDDVVDGSLSVKAESEFGADLEFDYGDYFDDNNMIVGEALRLKKVLGCSTNQHPELETLVSKVTDPNVQATQSVEVQTTQSQQTDEYMTLERPPPYHQVTKDSTTKRGLSSPNYSSPYDTDSSYPSESEHSDYSPKAFSPSVSYAKTNDTSRERRDSHTQTSIEQPQIERVISTEELLKLIVSSSQRNLSQTAQVEAQQKPQSAVQNLLFPAPQTKAASTGNIHSAKTFPGHVAQLYGNTDVNGDKTNLNRRRHQTPPPTYHKSHESLRRGKASNASVLTAKLVSSSENVQGRPTPSGRVFEEEVDCMRTKGAETFSSGEISSGSSIDEMVGSNTSPGTSVAYIGCEETKTLETLPRVKSSSQRKRRRDKVGFLSDQDIPTGVNNDKDSSEKLVELPREKVNNLTPSIIVKPSEEMNERSEQVTLSKKDIPKLDLNESTSPLISRANTSTADQIVHFPNDNHPSPNSVNVFIDYKKNVMKVTTSTPKFHHGKLVTESPTGLSPVTGSPTEEKKRLPKSSMGHEEYPPKYDSSSSSERSSVYSSDDEKFFGSCDTVVFVENTSDNQSDKPPTDVTLRENHEPCTSNGHDNDGLQDEEAINAYTARVDSLLREVRSSLDVDSIGSELLDQAMERVKDKLSPRSPRASEVFGGLTMEAYAALHQADELQAIINEIKGELQILQEENNLLKETVVSLQHGDSHSTSETTEASLTESAERIESIRKQIAAVVVNKQADKIEEEDDLINIDVYLRGFGEAVGLKSHKKTDVKLGQVTVKGGADWTGVYDAAKTTFLEHIKHIDTSSCLGLGPTSMYGAQIGATMLTPDTLRKKNPRVEISRKFNSCAIQLKDGMTDCFDTLIYDTLFPKHVVESYIHQILEHRFVVLCGSVGIGKTHLASKLAEHLAQRFGSKSQTAVLTLSVADKSRKELKKTLAKLTKCDISSSADGVPVVIILDQLDSLASLADIFEPKHLEGNRNSPFIIGVRNKSKKGPFSSKELAIHKYFRWIQMSVYDHHMLGLLERFLRRKLSWSDNAEEDEDLLDLFIWLTQVWQRINQILYSYVDVDVTIGPSVFYTCPTDFHAAEGWFANVWNYTVIPYLHQNVRNSRKIYERDVPWEDPTKWVIMRWPWSRERSKVLPTLKKLRQVDIVLNRNHVDSTKASKKESRSRLRKLKTNLVQSPSKAGSLESWSTVDWDAASIVSEDESIASSTL